MGLDLQKKGQGIFPLALPSPGLSRRLLTARCTGEEGGRCDEGIIQDNHHLILMWGEKGLHLP